MKSKVFTIPNLLTVLRLPFAFLIILYSNSPLKYLFLIIAILLDFFDGYIAKKYNQATKLGAILDPLFDKLFVLIVFSFFFIKMNLPFYFIFLFFTRDIVTSILALLSLFKSLYKKIEIKARILGKAVTALQFITLIFMVAENISLLTIGAYLVFIMSILAIIDYVIYIKKQLRISDK